MRVDERRGGARLAERHGVDPEDSPSRGRLRSRSGRSARRSARDSRARAGRATTAAAAATAARATTAACRARASASRRVAQHAAARPRSRRRATGTRPLPPRSTRMRAGARDAGERCVGGGEQRHRRRAERGREMREARVDADHDLARCARARRAPAATAAAARWRWARRAASRSLRCSLGVAAPRQQHRESRLREMREQARASALGPQLVLAARRVERERIRPVGHGTARWPAARSASAAAPPPRNPSAAAASARALSMKCWSRAMAWCTSSSSVASGSRMFAAVEAVPRAAAPCARRARP